MCAWRPALVAWCVLLALGTASGYTVDCNHEYADCDTELSKIVGEDDESIISKPASKQTPITTSTPPPTRSTATVPLENKTEYSPALINNKRVDEPFKQPAVEISYNKQDDTFKPTEVQPTMETETETNAETQYSREPTFEIVKPKSRFLNLNVDELQNFANALHNQTAKGKKLSDLSDVNLDDDDEEPSRLLNDPRQSTNKGISDKFYSNLQAPFHPASGEKDRVSEEILETCKENGIVYKIGERIDRGCEETCECSMRGNFDCSPRCKHPYIRRGRRLNDPLCFESPVDECCSIIACSTGSTDSKKIEICQHKNQTFTVGTKWHIGCEQSCVCEPNSVVTCGPRCKPLITSDKCINVQDPNDACCEVQVCDVSQDVHEQPDNATTTSSTTATVNETTSSISSTTVSVMTANENTTTVTPVLTTMPSSTISASTVEFTLPFEDQSDQTLTLPELTEPIGSVKVLQNNTVQVNLIHMNHTQKPIHLLLSSDGGKSFDDVELKYSNLILNLEGGKDYILKTKETGTKFNFTMTTTYSKPTDLNFEDIEGKIGCWEDGRFYAVGEEFHIGCSELCECTGDNTRECAALVCPNHVGLELMAKGCVRWAPSPPAQPPNCCPRSARCLSDGTCHYNGVPVPNWSEVPLTLTGCEQRCFCENGELDCQEVCSPLPPVPPQTLRCPPQHKPAAVNISDDDCCKQWACVPSADSTNGTDSLPQPYPSNLPPHEPSNYAIPVSPYFPIITTTTEAPITTTLNNVDFYKFLSPIRLFSKPLKLVTPVPTLKTTTHSSDFYTQSDNMTVFTLDDVRGPYKMLTKEPPYISSSENFDIKNKNLFVNIEHPKHSHPEILNHIARDHVEIISHDRPGAVNALTQFGLQDINQNPFTSLMNLPNRKTPGVITHKSQIHPNRVSHIHQELLGHTGHNHHLDHAKMNYHEPDTPKNPQKTRVMPQKSSVKWYAHNEASPQSEAMKKVPISTLDNFNYFLPTHEKKLSSVMNPRTYSASLVKESNDPKVSFFEPVPYNRTDHPKNYVQHNDNNHYQPAYQTGLGKHVTVLKSKDMKNIKEDNNVLWAQDGKAHVLTKTPNPYETVLMNAVRPTAKGNDPIAHTVPQAHNNFYSTLNLEHLLSQMEVESEVNRNLGRSADNGEDSSTAGHAQSPILHQTPPSFLPTIPTDVSYPHEDTDYEQNNVHRQVDSGLPLQLPNSFGDLNKKLSVITIESDSPTSIKMLLGLPPVLVGLRGSVDLRYTDKADEDVARWYSQVFAPADEVLTTPRLEFRLTGLKPSTIYKIRGKLYLHNLPVSPESDIYSVRTEDLPESEEKRREVNSRLTVVDVNDTSAHVTWRHFTEDELHFIDGIQVRYRPIGTPIFSMTELLHHSRSSSVLNELRPGTRYEASLVLIPPPRSVTELVDPAVVQFMTKPYYDPYNWTVTVDAIEVGSEAAQVTWRGVPAPAERWVRVYRAAHACDTPHTPVEHDEFRLAGREQPPAITLTALTPNSRCRIWLELFLTNGKVKTSNVLEIVTKPLNTENAVDNEIEASSISGGSVGSVGAVGATGPGGAVGARGDYYTALVGVGVVAALGALTSLLLLLVVVRRHRPRSVPITPVPSAPRESSLPPYDNPAYKLELQQETMDL